MSYHQPKAKPAVMREMSIKSALEWAFAVEKAQIDFDTWGTHEFARVGISPEWRGMRMMELGGVMVHGTGSNDPAADASVIAGAVEALPEGCGGRRMAVQLVELARTRGTPDWGQGERCAITCPSWDWKDGGWQGFTAPGLPWRWYDAKNRKWRERRFPVCPISYTGTAAHVAAMRRNYLLWYGALLHLVGALQGNLQTIQLTGALPDMSPWRNEGGNGE